MTKSSKTPWTCYLTFFLENSCNYSISYSQLVHNIIRKSGFDPVEHSCVNIARTDGGAFDIFAQIFHFNSNGFIETNSSKFGSIVISHTCS